MILQILAQNHLFIKPKPASLFPLLLILPPSTLPTFQHSQECWNVVKVNYLKKRPTKRACLRLIELWIIWLTFNKCLLCSMYNYEKDPYGVPSPSGAFSLWADFQIK